MAKGLHITVTIKPRWFFGYLFDVARFMVLIHAVEPEDAARYVAKHGMKYKVGK